MAILLLFVGPAKSLTSSLDFAARGNKQIILPSLKETHFLCSDVRSLQYYSRLINNMENRLKIGSDFFTEFFSDVQGENIYCEFCPSYILSKRAMITCREHIKRIIPIVTYRNPTKRTESHIKMDLRLGLLKGETHNPSKLSKVQIRQYYTLSNYKKLYSKWLSYTDSTILYDPLSGNVKFKSSASPPRFVLDLLANLSERIKSLNVNESVNIPTFMSALYTRYITGGYSSHPRISKPLKWTFNRFFQSKTVDPLLLEPVRSFSTWDELTYL